MKLTHVRIKDFRSFSGSTEFDLSDGPNYLVGPNNCGKSNFVRALELALDPDIPYVPGRDRPVRDGRLGAPPKTRITLTFAVGKSGPEQTLLRRAREYEVAVRDDARPGEARTFADAGEIRMVTSFTASGVRQTTFQAKGMGAKSLRADSDEHQRLVEQFDKVLRFAVVHSGEDLESLLAGKFREILRLVIDDHLKNEIDKANTAREAYISTLQSELLAPLREQIQDQVGGTFPEITLADLVPNVPTLDETLSSVDVRLGDAMTTQLAQKGTGVRGAVLVSMLRYLAEQSRRSLVLAVEEPEAFLHPAAQESIRHELDELARFFEVTLLVTTHSPYVISRRSDARIIELSKDRDGTTRRARTAVGTEQRAQLLSSLYRDSGVAEAVEQTQKIPGNAEVVVITEGYTDGLFLEFVCDAIGRPELLDGMWFVSAGGASKVPVQALTAASSTGKPVIALLDHDAHGRAAQDLLKKLNWSPKTSILSLRNWPDACTNHDIEIEDLLPVDAVDAVVTSLGEDVSFDGMQRCGAHRRHLSLTQAWKEEAIKQLRDHLPADDPGGMVWLAEELGRRATKMIASREHAEAHRSTSTNSEPR